MPKIEVDVTVAQIANAVAQLKGNDQATFFAKLYVALQVRAKSDGIAVQERTQIVALAEAIQKIKNGGNDIDWSQIT